MSLLKYIGDYNSAHNKYMIRFSLNSDFNSLMITVARRLDNIKVKEYRKDLNKVKNIESYEKAMIDTLEKLFERLERTKEKK